MRWPCPRACSRPGWSGQAAGQGRGIPFEIPDRSVLPSRMAHVLEAVYGTYTIDWPIAGVERRGSMTAEALYLAETLATLAPEDGETHALAALICLSAARAEARHGPDGAFVPLAEQETRLWSTALVERGRAHLRRAHSTGAVGRYSLEAGVQAVHVARRDTGTTDWHALLELHRAAHQLTPTLGSVAARPPLPRGRRPRGGPRGPRCPREPEPALPAGAGHRCAPPRPCRSTG